MEGGREDRTGHINQQHLCACFRDNSHSLHYIFLSAQAPKKVTKKPAKKAAPKANPLFVAEPRSFRVGGAIRVRNLVTGRIPEGVDKGLRIVTSILLKIVVAPVSVC